MDIRGQVLDYLQAHHVMTLATVDPDGPAAAAVFYASRGLDLCFLTAPHSHHGRNMHADPRVAVTIHDDCAQWSAIKGLQLTGTVRILAGEDLDAARTRYGTKFRDVPVFGAATGALARALLRIRWYELAVAHVRFIDNSRGFGHREEWSRAEFIASGVAPT